MLFEKQFLNNGLSTFEEAESHLRQLTSRSQNEFTLLELYVKDLSSTVSVHLPYEIKSLLLELIESDNLPSSHSSSYSPSHSPSHSSSHSSPRAPSPSMSRQSPNSISTSLAHVSSQLTPTETNTDKRERFKHITSLIEYLQFLITFIPTSCEPSVKEIKKQIELSKPDLQKISDLLTKLEF